MSTPTVSSIRKEMNARTSNAGTRQYGSAYNAAKDYANALTDYGNALRQQEEYERYKRRQELQNVAIPDMTADSMASYAQYKNTVGAQLAGYDNLSDDVKSDLGNISKTKKDESILGFIPNPFGTAGDLENEFREKYGVSKSTLQSLEKVHEQSLERDDYNDGNGDGAYEQLLQDNAQKNYVRTYPEEIDYANNRIAETTDDVDGLRADIRNYNTVKEQYDAANTGGGMAGMMRAATNSDKYDPNKVKQQIMKKYGLTDDEFEDASYYGGELDDYDDRLKQQEEARANVNTGSTSGNIAGGVKNSAIALAANPLAGVISTGATVGDKLRLSPTKRDKHSPLNVNSDAFALTNAVSDYQGATQQKVSDWNSVAGMVYGAGMSAAESFETSLLAPGGAAAGASAAAKLGLGAKGTKAAIKAGQAVAGLAPFGANAFSSQLSENVSSGQEMDDSMTDALISAGIEVGTELLPFDNFWEIAKGNSRTARKIVTDFIAQSGIEGLEEVAGDVADYVIDQVRNGDQSEFNRSIQNIMNDNPNMTEDEARSQAQHELVMQALEDFATGAMSGAMGGAGATAIGIHTNNQNANELFSDFGQQDYTEFADGLNTDESTYVNKSAAKSMQEAKTLAEKYATQDSVSNKEKRALYNAYTDAVNTEEQAEQEQREREEAAARKAEKRAARNANQPASDTAVESAPAQSYPGIGNTSSDAVVPFADPTSAEAMQYRAAREEESAQRAEQDHALTENMPEELRPASNDYTGNEIHKRMTKATTVEDLQNVVIDGMMSSNNETRKQTALSLEALTPMLNKNISMEEIESLKQSDADIIRAGYNGDEISTFTNRQKQLYNYGRQQAIETRTAVNNEQRELMVEQSQSIKDDNMRELVTSNFQTGYNTGAYMNTLKGIANAQRNGMSFEEALDTVKVNADAIGGDEAVIKAAEEAVFNHSVDLTRAETMNEIQKSMGLQNRVTKFGNGLFTDARSDKTSDLNGAATMRNIAKATGFNIVVYDEGVSGLSNTLRESQGVFRASNSTIYLNASEADHLAGVLYHELGEAISVYAPEEYQKFSKAVQNAVIKKIGINAFNEAREKYIADYVGEAGKTDVDIDKEMTNDLLYQFLGTEDGMKALLDEIDSSNTAEDARTIKQKLADWVADLARTLREFFDGFKPTAYQRKVADAQIAQLENLSDMLNKSAAAAIRNYQQARVNDQQSGANAVSETTELSDEQIDAMFDPNNKEPGELPDGLGFVDNDGTLRFSLATKDTSMKFLQDYLNRQKDLTEAQKEDIINRLELAAKITQDLADQQYAYFSTWQKMGLRTAANGVPLIDIIPKSGDKPLASVAVNNGEYPLNVDFSQICKKRATLNAVINTLVDEYGVLLPTLTESDLNTINKHIKDHGFEIACGLCFVDAKRYRSGKWAESFTGEYSPSMKRKYNRKTKQYDEYYELKKPKNAKVGYNDLVATLAAKDGSEVSASYFDYSTKNKKPNIRTIDQLSEEEIDKSGLLEYFKPYAKYNENGELTGIGGYKDENGTRKNPDEVAKMAYAIYSDEDMRHFLDKNDMMSDAGLDAIRDNNPTLYSLINAHWGAGKPKLNLGGTAYGGEIIRSENWGKNNDFNAESAKKVGGVRVQSFSDYEANMFFDYCQMFADMEARKLFSHGYSKETDYVRIFGLTGQKINMSIVARGAKLSKELEEAYNRLTNNSNTKLFTDKKYGKIFQDIRDNSGINREAVDKWMKAHPESAGMSVSDAARQMLKEGMSVKDVLLVEADEETGINETFNLDDALYYQNAEGYKDNCGIIWIGTSDAQIWALLDAEEVPMIIPYHSSGVSGFIKRERNLLLFHDYTKEQNTRFRDGTSITGEDDAADGGKAKKISKGVDFNFYEALYRLNDPKAAADEYLAWCDQHDYIPKFDTFRGHDNYYKLLIDFKVYDYNGIDPARVATRQYLPQQAVRLNLPENVAEMVKESVTAQEALIDRRNKELTAGGKNLLSDIARDLHLEERAKEEAQIRRGVDDLGLSETDGGDRYSKAHVDEEILEAAKSVYDGSNEKITIDLNDTITKELTDAISKAVGFDVTGYSNELREVAIQHVRNYHGAKGVHDSSMSNPEDLAKIKWVIANADSVWLTNKRSMGFRDKNGKPSKTVCIQKKIGDKYYYLIEAVPDTKRRKLEVVSAYKLKIDLSDQAVGEIYFLDDYVRDEADLDKSIESTIAFEDSAGKKLSRGQREYFNGSKAVDDDGRLKVMLHGTTSAGFTVFDPAMSDDGTGLFFTDNDYIAGTYSDTSDTYAPSADDGQPEGSRRNYQVYLDLKNPMVVDYEGRHWNEGELRKRDDVVKTAKSANKALSSKGTPYGLESYIDQWINYDNRMHTFETYVESTGALMSASAEGHKAVHAVSDMLENELFQMVTDGAIGADVTDMLFDGTIQYNTRDYVREAKANGYDGVIFKNIIDEGPYSDQWREQPSTVMVAFNSNQVKSVNNENPTEDIDIRRSMNLDENRNMNNEQISEDRDKQAAILEKGTEALKGTKVNDNLVDRITDNILNRTSSAYDRATLNNNLRKTLAYLHSKGNVNKNDLIAVMQDVVRPVIDAAYTTQASREDYTQFRNAVGSKSFSINEDQRKAIKDAFGSMATFERYYPDIHISEDAPSLTSQWSDLVGISRGLMESDVEEADMPGILADTFEALRPSMNDFEDQTQAAYELALETISDYLANYHNDGATKGVINEMVDDTARKLKASQKEWKKAARERYDERLKEERKRLRDQSKERVKAVNDRKDEQIARLRAKNATRVGDIYERQRKREQLRNIRKTYKRLYDYATKPTDQKHIPTVLEEPVYNLLAAFDMSGAVVTQGEDGKWHTKIISGRAYDDQTGKYKYTFEEIYADTKDDAMRQYNEALERGLGTRNGREWYNRMQQVNELYKGKAKAEKDGGDISQEMSDVYELLSDELADEFDQILKDSASSKATLTDLSSDQLRTISDVFRNVMHAVNYVNKSFTVPSAEVRQMAYGVIDKSNNVAGRKTHNIELLNKLDDFMGIANMNPHTYMHVIGADRMIDVLIYGQNTKAARLKQAQEYGKELFKDMSDAEFADWNKERTYLNGKVKATPFQIINIYNAAQRPDAAQHFPGGLRMRDRKGHTSNDVYHLTSDEIRQLTDTLTDKQLRIADGMQQFLANDCADWNNQTSEQIYGYSHFGDPHYWTITTDKTTVRSNPGELTGSITNSVKNMGMTKAIKQGANNPLIIDSAFDVYLKHINDSAVYSSWAAPLQDMLRFFNYKEIITHDDGRVEYITTKNAIRKMLGDKGNQYFTKLFADIQHREQSSYEDPGIISPLTGNAKKAATMANIRVALQQPTAIMRAGKSISYKYLEQGVRSGMPGADTELKRLQEQMIDTDMVYWIKQQGNIDGQITTSFTEQITGFKGTGYEKVNNQITEAAGWLPGYMDQITWEAMYRACIAEQIDALGRDKIGTQEFRSAVNYKFDHLMLETQVYDGTITRSQFMRSNDTTMKLASSFMAEPVKTYNLVLSDAIDLMQSGDDTAMRKVASKAMRKTLKVLAYTAVVNAAAQSLWDAFRNAGDPDDEDDLNFIQRFFEAMGWNYNAETWQDQLYAMLAGNLADNLDLLNNVPIISDYWSDAKEGFLKTALGQKSSSYASSSDSLDSAWIGHMGSWLLTIQTMLTQDQKAKDNSTKTGYDLFAKTARVVSDFTGIPAYSAQRDLVAFYNTVIARGISGGRLPVILKTKTSDKRQTKNDVYKTILNSSDISEVKAAIDEAASHSNTYKSINDDMKDNLKDDLIETYNRSPSEAAKMINRIVEMKAYCGDQYDTPKGKTHSERVEYYKKKVKEWLE